MVWLWSCFGRRFLLWPRGCFTAWASSAIVRMEDDEWRASRRKPDVSSMSRFGLSPRRSPKGVSRTTMHQPLRYFRLWLALARYSLVRELAFRSNFLVKIFVEVLWLGILIAFYETVF